VSFEHSSESNEHYTPPAIVLAGMALGGLICGRSILSKRRKSTKETT
jgi:hypothetical protein